MTGPGRRPGSRNLPLPGAYLRTAQVAELTHRLPATYTGWPTGMRVITRRERPHPGAQLRLTDHDGWRITVFATNTVGGRIPEASCDTGNAPAPKTASAA